MRKVYSFKILSSEEFEVKYFNNFRGNFTKKIKSRKTISMYRDDFTLKEKRNFFDMLNKIINEL
jgi:hypothetical protein